MAEEPSLPYYLPIAGGRIIGFIPFPRVLVQCEMQSVSSRIWTCVAVSISYDDNHHTMGTSQKSLYKRIKVTGWCRLVVRYCTPSRMPDWVWCPLAMIHSKHIGHLNEWMNDVKVESANLGTFFILKWRIYWNDFWSWSKVYVRT